MLTRINGLHHVTAMAASAQENNRFFTRQLGLRRVKKTVNFDEPSVYHLYYGDETGTPGTVMTYFPFPHIGEGRRGTGEVVETAFAVPKGTLDDWLVRLHVEGIAGLNEAETFGEKRLRFLGPDGDSLALVEVAGDARAPFAGSTVPVEAAIRGLHGVTLGLRDTGRTADLLGLMGYSEIGREGAVTRFAIANGNGNGADIVDLEALPNTGPARPGAGSVHHVAFSVRDRAAQLEVRKALVEAGQQVTQVIDRDYFWSIYFRTSGGVLFEIATEEPGFARDEDVAHLGEALKLPAQHAHLRERIEARLETIAD